MHLFVLVRLTKLTVDSVVQFPLGIVGNFLNFVLGQKFEKLLLAICTYDMCDCGVKCVSKNSSSS